MKLSGSQKKTLHQVLLRAFPRREALQRIVSYDLEQNLNAIAGSGRLEDVIFNLIEWAESEGRTEDLLRAVQGARPKNDELAAFIKTAANSPTLSDGDKGGVYDGQTNVDDVQGPIRQEIGTVASGGTVIGTVIGGSGDVRIGGQTIEGDTFNMSGDFRGAILNINSTLQDVSQSIAAMPHGTADEKAQLGDLIKQLERELGKIQSLPDAPATLSEESEKMARRVKALVEEASDTVPDEEMVKTWGDKVRDMAAEVGKFLPEVLPLATKIVTQVIKMLP